jgi:hypothetical protein
MMCADWAFLTDSNQSFSSPSDKAEVGQRFVLEQNHAGEISKGYVSFSTLEFTLYQLRSDHLR